MYLEDTVKQRSLTFVPAEKTVMPMRPIYSFFLPVVLFFFLTDPAMAQVRLYASVIPQQGAICLDEMAEYRIVLENSADKPELRTPHFKNFMVMGSPGTEEGMSSVNGHVTRYVAWVFTLRPLKKGIFRIEPARASIAGKTYSTEAVTIEVRNCKTPAGMQAGQPYASGAQQAGRENLQDMMVKNGEDPLVKAKENLALVLDVDRKSCYVGEPVEVNYKLLSRLHCESKINKQPSFNGFSVIDLPFAGSYGSGSRNYKGKEYNVYMLRRSQAYPLQAGTIEIEPAEIENEVTFVKEDFVKQQGMESWVDEYSLPMLPREAIVKRNVFVSNEPVTITVKPLPEEGRPASFDGAVGQLMLETSVQKRRFALNETGLLTLVVRGKGNMTLLTAPFVSWPAGLDAFEPKYKEELDKTTIPVSGRKVFEIAFSAQKEGEYIIPPIRFSYFDPVKAVYEEVASDSFHITVDPPNPDLNPAQPTGQQEKLSFINRIFYHRWWIILFVAAAIISGLILWVWYERKQSAKTKESGHNREPEPTPEETEVAVSAEPEKHPLAESAACLENDDLSDFYRVLNREFREQLCRTFALQPFQCTPSSLPEYLDKKSVPLPVVLKTQSLMQSLEQVLYSPLRDDAQARALYDEALELIQHWKPYA